MNVKPVPALTFKMELKVRLEAGCNQRALLTHCRKLWNGPLVWSTSFVLAVLFPHVFASNKTAVSLPFSSCLSGEE